MNFKVIYVSDNHMYLGNSSSQCEVIFDTQDTLLSVNISSSNFI